MIIPHWLEMHILVSILEELFPVHSLPYNVLQVMVTRFKAEVAVEVDEVSSDWFTVTD